MKRIAGFVRALGKELLTGNTIYGVLARLIYLTTTVIGLPTMVERSVSVTVRLGTIIGIVLLLPYLGWAIARAWIKTKEQMATPDLDIGRELEATAGRGIYLLRMTNRSAIPAHPIIHADAFDASGHRVDPHLPQEIPLPGEILPYGGQIAVRILFCPYPGGHRAQVLTAEIGKGIELPAEALGPFRLELAIRVTPESRPILRAFSLDSDPSAPNGLRVTAVR